MVSRPPPGTWLQISGSNLAATTRTWQPSDFNGKIAPVSLDGVGVTIGGKDTFVKSVSPAQVIVQVPNGIPIGDGVPLVLTNAQGATSPYILHTSDLAPALMAPAVFKALATDWALAASKPADHRPRIACAHGRSRSLRHSRR